MFSAFSRFYGSAAWRIFARSQVGSTITEFALLSPFLVVFILAGLQISVAFLAKSYLETATEAAARIVQTNQASSMTQAQFQAAVCSELTALFSCANVIVQLEPAPTSVSQVSTSLPQFNSNGTLLNPTSFSVGAPGTKMMLIVMYQWPVFGGPLGFYIATLNNAMLITSTQIFQIEPSND